LQISTGRLIVRILLGVYAILLAYVLLGLVLGFTVSADIFFDLSFALLFFAIAQSIFELGTKNALLFLVLSSVIGYAAEVLGTSTGFPFGQYNYSELLGPKVLGVPVVVPFIWFVISYVTLSAVQGTVTSGSEKRRREQYSSSRFNAILSISMLSALGAMAWDLLIDPMFTSYGYWVWDARQPIALPRLSGIPLTNFLGWFVLVFVMVAIYLRFGTKTPNITKRNNTYDSYIVYVMLLIDGVVANWQLGHYLVIEVGASTMIAFLALSIIHSMNSNRNKTSTGSETLQVK
jgi:uncharacterized membrane protein